MSPSNSNQTLGWLQWNNELRALWYPSQQFVVLGDLSNAASISILKKEGIIEKISYERRVYESVDVRCLS